MRMQQTSVSIGLLLFVGFATSACGDSGQEGGTDPDDPAAPISVSGTVVDFETGEAIAGSATISVLGISPAPSVTVTGADFAIDDVPPFSVFHVLSGSPPGYRSTYNNAIVVDDADIDGVVARAVSEEFIARLGTGFGISAPQGILMARAIDMEGNGRAGIPATAFQINDGTDFVGPYFLDAELAPAPAATATSASGWVVFFEVAGTLVTVNAVVDSGYNMTMPLTPVAATAATLAELVVEDGPPELPTNVSFQNDVVPIFDARGCEVCHSGNGIGRDLGNLTLDASPNLIYREVAEELSPGRNVRRVDIENPEASLLLTMPSAEDPPDAHPNTTFLSPTDPDYLTIKAWIAAGALDN